MSGRLSGLWCTTLCVMECRVGAVEQQERWKMTEDVYHHVCLKTACFGEKTNGTAAVPFVFSPIRRILEKSKERFSCFLSSD